MEDLSGVARILNCENNEYVSEGEIDVDIQKISAQFETPLNLQKMLAVGLEIVEEWHDIAQYSLDILSPLPTIIEQLGSSCFTRHKPPNGV